MNRVSIFITFLLISSCIDASRASDCLETKEKSDAVRITSPDGNLEFELFLQDDHLMYELTFHDQPVLESSKLGLVINGEDLGQGASRGKHETFEKNESYNTRGKHATAINHFNGLRIAFTYGKRKIPYAVEVKVFDNGVAFRYILYRDDEYELTSEVTSFKVPHGTTVWYHGVTSMHYEEKHKEADVSALKAGEWVAPPMTFRLPGGSGFASITESGIITNSGENFPGMALEADGISGFRARLGHEHPENYPYVLRYKKEDHQRLTKSPTLRGDISSPWRVVLVGADLNALFNSDVISNVAPEPDPTLFPNAINEEWLKPGRSVWGYLTDEPRTLEGMKNLSRLAGELGFEYHTVEGHWARWSFGEQKELVDYSNERNVKLIFWKHSRDLRDAEKRQEFFKLLHDLGVAGAKIDFFDHEAKEIIDLYAACLREAAEYKLILNFHGANKPTGQDRTWPNEMAREGVFGMEFRGPWAKHNTTIPFTRLLAGHMDYTVISFGDRRSETSETHQLASALVLQSPFLVFAEHPKNLLNHPAVGFIKQIPCVWDETIVLSPSEIGQVAAFARRSGDKWFVSVMNGEAGKTITIDLSFLGEGDYNATLIHDKKPDMAIVSLLRSRQTFGAQHGINIVNVKATSRESLFLELIPGGGFVGVFQK